MSTSHLGPDPDRISATKDHDGAINSPENDTHEQEGPSSYLLWPVYNKTNSEPTTLTPGREEEGKRGESSKPTTNNNHTKIPLFSALSPLAKSPSPYPVIDSALQDRLSKEFRSRTQLKQLLLTGFLLWLRTAILLALLGITLWAFVRKPVMSDTEKKLFNAIMTGVSIALGLNISVALNEMALNMRWWFLSRRKRSLAEVESISPRIFIWLY